MLILYITTELRILYPHLIIRGIEKNILKYDKIPLTHTHKTYMVKNLPANPGDARDVVSIPGWEDPLK